eukprot:CAMPEP_0172710430 /NCGR_PEP_ID=MMETSP1074-20121228/55656_1 /TAXON_ID=2916 /ORGANISM="Ceratium fusus, Strain PA161109" /LENGTH=317 /DNA_ID=CAMNT_0013533831 /DNA_START=29 /DNA_END=982 /DNA_ORIENTATION=+
MPHLASSGQRGGLAAPHRTLVLRCANSIENSGGAIVSATGGGCCAPPVLSSLGPDGSRCPTSENRKPNIAEAHQKRREITGSICLQVQYHKAKILARDVQTLTVLDGRVFVGELDKSGNAHHAGVRPGDELVRVKIGQGAPQAPEPSPMALRLLATEPSLAGQPTTAFFMGFKGRLSAEVQLANEVDGHSPELPTNLTKLVGDASFEMLDYSRFRPTKVPSLFLASRADCCQSEDDLSTQTGGSEQDLGQASRLAVLAQAHNDLIETCAEPDQCPVWHLMELKQHHARLLLAGAMLNISSATSDAEPHVLEPRIISC